MRVRVREPQRLVLSKYSSALATTLHQQRDRMTVGCL